MKAAAACGWTDVGKVKGTNPMAYRYAFESFRLLSQLECGVDLAPGAPCTMRSARPVVKLSSSSDARFVITRSELGYAAL